MNASQPIRQFALREEAMVTVPYLDGEDPVTKAPRYSQGVGEGGVRPDNPAWTVDECLERFRKRIATVEDELTRNLKVPVSQREYDGMWSCTMNRGLTRMLPVIALVNQDKKGSAWAMMRSLCVKSNGEYSEGLANRRDREIAVIRKGDFGRLDGYKLFRGPPSSTIPIIKDFPPEI